MQKITLITASYNSEKTIADTIQSVAAQDYGNIEYLIVDGASSDGTMQMVERNSACVTQAVSEPDKGIYDAYNRGLKRATGDIIGFINSDDFYCSPTVISEVMNAFEDEDLEALHADLVYVDPEDTDQILRHWRSRPCTESSLSRGFIPAHPTLFLRRSVYEKAGNFNLDFRLAADYEFMLRIFHTHKVKARYIPNIWVKMRSGGATGGNFSSIKLQNVEIRKAQKLHGVSYPGAKFLLHKVIDRTKQRLRARKVNLPTGVPVR
jgi:glycosyltransferase involved in cell wall biosynthesis